MDSDSFRRILGSFPTGVTVLTTAVDGEFHGVTVNSLTSVSLDPQLVLVCIDKQAVAHGQIQRAGQFGVSFLAAAQEETSRLFAVSAPPDSGQLRGALYRLGSHGVPILEGSLAWLECALTDQYPGGDHTVFLGAVLAGGTEPQGNPLIYFRGRYRGIAN